MSMNLVAMLVSLAMLLTGAGGAGMPDEAARTLTVHNISLTVNGERVDLDTALRLGAYTDGEKALYSFGIDAGGETLLPVQLSADAAGLTALVEKGDAAVRVTEAALEGLAQLAPMPQAQDGESAELMAYMTGTFLPAYAALFDAIGDEAFAAEVQANAEAILEKYIDRGEGTPVSAEVDGKDYALTEYHYTVDTAQLSAYTEAILTSNEVFKNYRDALFGLYARLPEESGLRDIKSYQDLFDKTGITIDMEMTERRSDDGEIDLTDAVMTMDMSGVAAMLPKDAGELPKLEPLVMNLHATKAGASQLADMDMRYAMDETEMEMSMRVMQDDDSAMVDMAMYLYADGASAGSLHLNLGQGVAGAKGATHSHANLDFDLGDQGRVELSYMGRALPEGVGQHSVELAADMDGVSFELSFDADVTAEAIEDHVTGRDPVITIDDLSEDGLSALMQDQNTMTALTQLGGALSADLQKLTANEGVQSLVGLFSVANTEPVVEESYEEEEAGDDEDAVELEDGGEYVIELGPEDFEDFDLSDYGFEDGDYEVTIEDVEDDEDYDIDDYGDDYPYEEVEDDGELGFNVPELTWLPAGWAVTETSQDTAYDWVDMSVADENGDEGLYVLFFEDVEESKNYIVSENGNIAPVEGREVSVADYGEGSLSVTLREGDVYVTMMFASDAIDVETIGKIAAGIKF